MTEHRYIFEKGSKKHRCPNCDKKRFVRYIDTQTGEYLPEKYGRCDRQINCGYTLNPYSNGYAKAIWEQEQGNKTDWKPQLPKFKNKPINKPKKAFIPVEVLTSTLSGYENNSFVQNLLQNVSFPFDVQDIEKVISLYRLGTVPETGACSFPFIDIKNQVNAIQEKIFNLNNNTDKTKKYHTSWTHSRLTYKTFRNKSLPEWLKEYNETETKVSCLFGEHLLSKYPQNPVALVEAPKGAIYGTLYFGFPEQPTNLLWLSVFNLSSLTLDKCKALKGRSVYLFPDLSKDGKAFELWSNKAKEFEGKLQGTRFDVSDLLEQLAPEQDKEEGNDIADYLIKQDWRLFRGQKPQPKIEQPPEPEQQKTVTRVTKVTPEKKDIFLQNEEIEPEQPENWDNEIKELEGFYQSATLPSAPIQLNKWSTVIDPQKYVYSNLQAVKTYNGNRHFLPHLGRLQYFKTLVQSFKGGMG